MTTSPESEFMRLYGRLIEKSPDGVFVGTRDGVTLRANAVACRILGYSEAELARLGRGGILVDDPPAREFVASRQREGFARGLLRMRRSDGSTVPVDVTSWVLKVSGGEEFAYVVIREVAEQDGTRRELEAARRQLKAIFDSSHDAILIADDESRYLDANPAACALLGRGREGIVGRTVFDMTPEGQRDAARQLWRQFIADGHQAFDYELERPDGTRVFVEYRARANILPGMHMAVLRDITERKSAEMALREREANLRGLFESPLVGMAITSPDKGWLQVNEALGAMLGYSREELQARTWAEVTHPDDIATDVARFNRVVAGEADSYTMDKRFIRKDGAVVWASIYANCVRRPDGSISHFVAIVADITERKRAEEALAASEERFRTLAEGAPVGIYETDARGETLYTNAECARITGLPPGGAHQAGWTSSIHPDDRQRVWGLWRKAAEAGTSFVSEHRFVHRDGHVLTALSRAIPLRDAQGRLKGHLGIVVDVTELRKAEAALRESETHYRLLAENASDVVWTIGPDLSVTYVSPSMETLTGFTPEEAVRRGIEEIHLPASQAASLGYFRTVLADLEAGRPPGSFRGDLQYRCKDGSTLWVDVSAVPVLGPDGRLLEFLGVSRDITARRRAEDALRERETLLRTIADSTPDAIFAKDVEGRWTFANEAVLELFQLTEKELIGRTDAEIVWGEDVAAAMSANDREVMASGKARNFEEDIATPEGTRHFLATKSPLRGPAGNVSGVVGVSKDVTSFRQMQEQLGVASRLAALGTLVAGVGHEINNPLAAAMANDGAAAADLADLQARLGAPGPFDRAAALDLVVELRESVEGALAADKRIAQIVKDLAVLGRTSGERERVKLRAVVDSSLRWLPPAVARAVAVQIDDRQPPDVMGQAGQLTQVVLNLVSNAAKAGRGGTPPRITVRIGPGRQGMARLDVVDDGIGMTPEVMKRIFDPFYSTRDPGQGMGLGLSICHAIVTEHGGTIRVASEAGKGSTFTVELPAVEPQPPR